MVCDGVVRDFLEDITLIKKHNRYTILIIRETVPSRICNTDPHHTTAEDTPEHQI